MKKEQKETCSFCDEEIEECDSCGEALDSGGDGDSPYGNKFWCVQNAGHFCLNCVQAANKETEEDEK